MTRVFLKTTLLILSDIVLVKEKEDFVQSLVAFPISNISYYTVMCQRSNLNNNNLSCDLVGTVTSHWRPLLAKLLYTVYMYTLYHSYKPFSLHLIFRDASHYWIQVKTWWKKPEFTLKPDKKPKFRLKPEDWHLCMFKEGCDMLSTLIPFVLCKYENVVFVQIFTHVYENINSRALKYAGSLHLWSPTTSHWPKMQVQARGVGGTQYKRPYGDVPPTWVVKSTFWYISDSF